MLRPRRTTVAELGMVLAIVFAIQAHSCATQKRIDVNGGQGYDGEIYHDVAERIVSGERPSGVSRFVRRVGTPFAAAFADSNDLINGFQRVNVLATVISTVLLLVWLRRYVKRPWLRIGLVLLYATHWLQLVRFTFFYPVLVDPWSQVACIAGLYCVMWYERTEGRWPLAAVSAISFAGLFLREVVLLVPIAFLFARNPRIEHLTGFPYLRVRSFPRLSQWVPLALALAATVAVDRIVIATDTDFSALEHLQERAFSRNVFTYLLGWLVAFGPATFVVLVDWRSAARFLLRHRALLIYLLGVAAVGWAGSLESERHALYFASPIAYVLLGRAIERHLDWFRSPPLAALLIGAQALVHRVFWTVPQPTGDYESHVPAILLTPVGDDVGYLHLFPDYVGQEMVWIQLGEHVMLGAVILLWISRRVRLTASEGAPAVS